MHFPIRFINFYALLPLLTLLATPALAPADSIVVGDHSNPFNPIDFLSPNNGVAQRFTITSGIWDITSVKIRLGNQSIVTQIDPIVQIRDASGPGGGPGYYPLGSFNIDGSQIPPWTFGGVNTAIVQASPSSSFQLPVGAYWLTLINADVGDAILACFTSAAPLQQDGVGGNFEYTADIFKSYDAGVSFAPAYGGFTLLAELDGIAIPEPASLAFIFIAPLVLRSRPRAR
jgi:hypothetical protein